MESLGITASIISLIQLTAKVTTLFYDYSRMKSSKQTSKAMQEFLTELNLLHQVLSIVRNIADSDLRDQAKQITYSEDFQKSITALQEFLLKIDHSERTVRGRIKAEFFLKEKEIAQFNREIKHWNTLFSTILAKNHDTLEVNPSTALAEIIATESRILFTESEKKRAADERRGMVLDWLYSESFDAYHTEISSNRMEDTGQWILRKPELKRWSTDSGTSSRLLWLQGSPGMGKTYITSVVIDHFKEQAGANSLGVAYLYFNHQEQIAIDVLLASLVKQFASQLHYLPPEIEQLYSRLIPQGKRPKIEELYGALLAESSLFYQSYIFFDGVDECYGGTLKNHLLPLIHRMAKDGIKVFLASRALPSDIQESLGYAVKLEITAADNSEDIERFIQKGIQRISQNQIIRYGSSLLSKTTGSRLAHDAGGMFLWAHLIMKNLDLASSSEQIRTELEKLPASLGSVYNEMIKNIMAQPQNEAELALSIFTWLVKARRPLLVEEIQIAVTIRMDRYELNELDLPDKETLMQVCGGLVIIDENSDTIRLAHLSIHEYLQEQLIISKDADLKIAIACCTYLSFDAFAEGVCVSRESFQHRLNAHPFLDYSAKHLAYHLKSCNEALTVEPFLKLLSSPGNITSYLQAKHTVTHDKDECIHDQYPTGYGPLHIASAIGHLAAVKHLIQHGSNIFTATDDGRTSLSLAASGGHEQVVHLLLDRGADLSFTDHDGWAALHWAAFSGHEKVAQLLVVKGVSVLTTVGDGKTALCLAATEGHESVVRFLFNAGADPFAQDDIGWTALHWAVFNGHKAVVEQFINKKADLNSLNKHKRSPLWVAASEGHESIVHMLLKNGVNIHSQDNNRRTPLHQAASKGHEKVVSALIRSGADLNSIDKYRQSPLWVAASEGHELVVRTLIQEGADIHSQDKNGRTPLYQAAFNGHREVVEELISSGADLESPDIYGRKPLWAATSEGHELVIRILIEKGAENYILDNSGSRKLYRATLTGHEAVAQTQLQNYEETRHLGTDRDIQISNPVAESEGQNSVAHLFAQKKDNSLTPIQQSLEIQDTETLPQTSPMPAKSKPLPQRTELRDHIAEVPIPNADEAALPSVLDKHTLFSAISRGQEAILQQMLAKGADISSTDKDGRTLLYQAAREGKERVVRFLLDNNADPLIPAHDSSTALCVAAGNGHERIAQLLLEKGANPGVVDKDGWTPLYRAVCNGHEEVVRLLHQKSSSVTDGGSPFICLASSQETVGENGPNFFRPDGYERTPLFRAAFKGQETIFRILSELGANLSDKARNGQTMLCVAASQGHEAVVQYLLDKVDLSTPDKDGWTPLHWATFKGYGAVFHLLVDNGADISTATKDGSTVLAFAASKGHKEMVEKLLQKGADVSFLDKYQRTPLYLASLAGHETVVQLLLESKSNPNIPDQDGRVPLYRAAYEGHEAVVKLLLDWGVYPSAQDSRGQTPLHRAVSLGSIRMTRLLLSKNASVAIVGNDGKTILALAASEGHEEVARLLLEHGADLSTKDKIGRTPLHRAASEGHEGVVRLLLDRGADASTGDKIGRTPLFQAASEGHDKVVKLLLERGADASTATKDGRTALRRARSEGHEAVIQLLETALK